jgi:hypothetical protein
LINNQLKSIDNKLYKQDENYMKKTIVLFTLSFLSLCANADAGFFLDGTVKYARTGIIQEAYPDIPLYQCKSYSGACESIAFGNYYNGIVFANYGRMKHELEKRKKNIISLRHVRKPSYKGFKLNVYDVVDVGQRNYVLIQVINNPKVKLMEKNSIIAKAIVNEFDLAYVRAGF